MADWGPDQPPWGNQTQEEWENEQYRKWAEKRDKIAAENAPGFCDLGWFSIVWVWVGYAIVLIPIMIVFGACACSCLKGFVTKWHACILAVNVSLWYWAIFLVVGSVCDFVPWSEKYEKYEHVYYQIGERELHYYYVVITIISAMVLITFVDAVLAPEGKLLLKKEPAVDVIEYLDKLKGLKPIHTVEVRCFHNVGYGHRGRGKGSERVTHTETREFTYDTWVDQTEYPDIMTISKDNPDNPIIVIQLEKSFGPGDPYTQQDAEIFRKKLCQSLAYRDQQVTGDTEVFVPDWEDKMVTVCEDHSKVPWYLNAGFFYLCCFLSISVWVRIRFRMISKFESVTVRKSYFSDPNIIKRYDFDLTGGPQIFIPNQGGVPMMGGQQYVMQEMPATSNPQIMQPQMMVTGGQQGMNYLSTGQEDIRGYSNSGPGFIQGQATSGPTSQEGYPLMMPATPEKSSPYHDEPPAYNSAVVWSPPEQEKD